MHCLHIKEQETILQILYRVNTEDVSWQFCTALQPVASKITATMEMYTSLLLSYLTFFLFANLFSSAFYPVTEVFLREGSHCVFVQCLVQQASKIYLGSLWASAIEIINILF